VQAPNAAPSSRHSKPDAASLEEKSNEAPVADVVPLGPDVIAVSGGVVSVGGLTALGS
jgi:hypothetical protein